MRDYFWDGEFRHEVGATVTNSRGDAHHPYAVFLSKSEGVPGVAIANYEDEAITVTVELESAHALTRYRLVDSDQWTPVNGGIAIPARSAAVVI